MLVSLTVGKVDAGVTVLLTPDKRLIEFPSILLPPNISSGSIVDIQVSRNLTKEATTDNTFRALLDRIYNGFGASSPTAPVLRCRNATQTSVVLEWDPIELATADLVSLSLHRNGQKAGNIPRPTAMHSTKISGLAVDTEYTFHLVLRTSAGIYTSEKVAVRTHKMTDLSGVTITTGYLPANIKENLTKAVERIGAKIVEGVRIDTTHFITTEGRGAAWEKAVETNIPVVRPEWVEACEKNGRILGVTKFYLDAMRPGPSPAEERAESTKQLPQIPAEGTGPQQQQQPQQQVKGEGEKQEEDSEDDDEDDNGEEEAEQKIKSPLPQEEQKVRTEDMQEQKVALRSKTDLYNTGGEHSKVEDEDEDGDDDEEDDEDDDDDDEDEEGTRNKKPTATPDEASFQEVEL